LSKAVLKSDLAPKKVLEYTPPKFELGTNEQAKAYLDSRRANASNFRMSDVIRVQTGVQKVEASNVEETVEQKVLERLKQVQESAYQEAYQLGLDEGKHEAFQQATNVINERLSQMDELLSSIRHLKKHLIDNNETHLVQLAFHMAKRLAHKEVEADPKVVTDVIRDAIEKAQVDEEVVVQVAPSQLEFLEKLKSETAREFEFLKYVKLEPVEGITPGGCVIETNYGEIDARFEERVDKLWESISESLHRVKDKISTE
jgi:flagellar assembly protein FliH